MLTKMFYEGADYDEVLKEAQDNGYAERNPEADVEGYDACQKDRDSVLADFRTSGGF